MRIEHYNSRASGPPRPLASKADQGNDTWWDSDQLFKSSDALFGAPISYSFAIGHEEVERAPICVNRTPLRGYWREHGVGRAALTELCRLHRGVVVALALPDAEASGARPDGMNSLPTMAITSTAYFVGG